jgi:hypothetical protein
VRGAARAGCWSRAPAVWSAGYQVDYVQCATPLFCSFDLLFEPSFSECMAV